MKAKPTGRWFVIVGALLAVTPLTGCRDSPNWTDRDLFNAGITWVNQTGLNQTAEDVWSERLDALCATDPDFAGLADQYVAEDAEYSVRSDGTLPSTEDASDSLLTIQRQTCRP